MSAPCGLLILRTSDLTTGSTSSVGTMNAQRCNMTWNGIDLRQTLGSMWDEYDHFSLSLSQVISDGNAATASTVNAVLELRMQGLPWSPMPYDTKTKQTTPVATLGVAILQQYSNTVYAGLNTVCFSKRQEQVQLNLFYTTVNGQTNAQLVTNANVYNHFIFVFKIQGVPRAVPRVLIQNSSKDTNQRML
jgi:hypothetical protein